MPDPFSKSIQTVTECLIKGTSFMQSSSISSQALKRVLGNPCKICSSYSTDCGNNKNFARICKIVLGGVYLAFSSQEAFVLPHNPRIEQDGNLPSNFLLRYSMIHMGRVCFGSFSLKIF